MKAAAAFRPKGGVYGQSGTGRTPCRRSNGAGVLVLGVTERCRFSFRRDVAARVATMVLSPPAAVLLTAVKVKTLMYRLQKQVHGCPVCQHVALFADVEVAGAVVAGNTALGVVAYTLEVVAKLWSLSWSLSCL